ncbi:MAG: hypothetical protein HYV75_07900 [Opitutae bacterium]|nr:hypothetical protein [Opitutae bacterium]
MGESRANSFSAGPAGGRPGAVRAWRRASASLLAAIRFALLAAAVVATAGEADESLPPLPPGVFTVVVIPDTQAYLGQGTKRTPDSDAPVTNPVFENHVRWIESNRTAQNIVFVSHVGNNVNSFQLFSAAGLDFVHLNLECNAPDEDQHQFSLPYQMNP